MKLHRFVDVWLSRKVDFIEDGKKKADYQAKLQAAQKEHESYPKFFGSVALGRYSEETGKRDQVIRRFYATNVGTSVELYFEKADNHAGKTVRGDDLVRDYSKVVCQGEQTPFFQSYTEG